MPEAPAPIAVVSDYQSFVATLRRRIIDMNVAVGSVERLAGLSPHHLERILRGSRAFGPASLGPALGALALKLVVVHDAEQMDRIRHRLPRRHTTGARIRDPGMRLAGRDGKRPTAIEQPDAPTPRP
jgi:hypothetical protein